MLCTVQTLRLIPDHEEPGIRRQQAHLQHVPDDVGASRFVKAGRRDQARERWENPVLGDGALLQEQRQHLLGKQVVRNGRRLDGLDVTLSAANAGLFNNSRTQSRSIPATPSKSGSARRAFGLAVGSAGSTPPAYHHSGTFSTVFAQPSGPFAAGEIAASGARHSWGVAPP